MNMSNHMRKARITFALLSNTEFEKCVHYLIWALEPKVWIFNSSVKSVPYLVESTRNVRQNTNICYIRYTVYMGYYEYFGPKEQITVAQRTKIWKKNKIWNGKSKCG